MPLQQQDLGKRTMVRLGHIGNEDDGKWITDGHLIGLPEERIDWMKKPALFARVRFNNGSTWQIEANRVRVIDETPAESQPPCLPGVADADTETQDH